MLRLTAATLALALSSSATAKDVTAKKRKKPRRSSAPAEASGEAPAKDSAAVDAAGRGASAARRAKGAQGAAVKYGSPGAGLLGFGAGADRTLDRSWQAGAGMFYVKQDLPTDVREVAGDGVKITTDKASITMIAAGVAGRYFLGNSFFVSGGVYVRSIAADFTLSVYTTTPAAKAGSFTGNVQAQSLLVNAFVGNQWLFDNGFYLTGEWLGYGLPVVYTHAYKQDAAGLVKDEAALDEVARIQDGLGKKLSQAGSLGLVVSLGWLF